MIQTMTEEQKKQMAGYRDKYIAKGLSCEPIDDVTCRADMERLYTELLDRQKPITVIMDNPLEAWVAVCFLSIGLDENYVESAVQSAVWSSVGSAVQSAVESSVQSAVESAVGSDVRSAVGSAVRSAVRSFVQSDVESAVWSSVRSAVQSAVRSAVGSSVRLAVWSDVESAMGPSVGSDVGTAVRSVVWSSVGSAVESSVRSDVESAMRKTKLLPFIWPWLDGQFDVHIFAFYDFMLEVMGVKIKPQLMQKYNIWKRTAEYGPIWPLEKFCVVCRRPQAIYIKGEQLHCETGPAVQYPRYGVYALNGVRVPKWLVMTPAAEITGDTILKESNAEIRREIIRKIGVERVVRDLGAECIDKDGEYELLLLDLQDGRRRPYLKMQNPSIDAVHIEGVHPDCLTVQAALRWRNGVDEKPLVLT